jgi:hypothetical protein
MPWADRPTRVSRAEALSALGRLAVTASHAAAATRTVIRTQSPLHVRRPLVIVRLRPKSVAAQLRRPTVMSSHHAGAKRARASANPPCSGPLPVAGPRP